MTLGMFVGFGILFMAIGSLALGLNMIQNVDMPKSEKYIIICLSIFAFLWCGGYGLMSLSETVQQAFWGRTVGLVGVYCFIVTCMRFFIFYCGKNMKIFNVIWAIDWVWALSCIVVLAKPKPQSVIFVRTEYGTAFYPIVSWIRYYAFTFIVTNLIVIFYFLIKGRRHSKFKRQKRILDILVCVAIALTVLSSLDGFSPSSNRASFPSSCIGVFFVMIMVNVIGFKFNAFSITKQSISKYVNESINMPVLLIDENHRILLSNPKADEYFGIKPGEKSYMFDNLFEITKEDANKYIRNVISGIQEKDLRVITKKSGAVCELSSNAVLDKYGELLCLVVFVDDLTRQYEAYEKLQVMKGNLEKQLEEKTRQMEEMTLQAITTVANFIDSKEAYTIGHSTRVAKYSEMIARELGWSEKEVINVHYVGLLHDIGKIGISHTILNKRSGLTEEEYETIKQHTIIGGDILKDIKTVEHVEEGALYHHEQYDGSGYPFGLEGDQIPLIARVIGIADAYDAMTSTRKYRNPLPDEIVRQEIEEGSGKQFDPYIADVLLRMMDEGRFQTVNEVDTIEKGNSILAESNMLMAKVIGNEILHTRFETELDYLTQIWNRKTGEKNVDEYLHVAEGALVIIDLDNFKEINNEYGHEAGDEVLQIVAEILKLHSENDFLCRLGSDQFMLFLKGVESVEQAKEHIEAIMYTFNSRTSGNDKLAHTSLSMGIALSKVEGRDYDNLFRCADRALYYVKQNGKHGFSFHNRAELSGVGNENVLDINKLVHSLKNHCDYTGAFKMEYGQFLHVHEFIEKYAMRNRQCIQLVLLTINYDYSVDVDIETRNVIMEDLEYAVTSTLRGVDVSTRFSNSQILLTLVDTVPENVSYVVRKLLKKFYLIHRPEDIRIDVDSADITVKAS